MFVLFLLISPHCFGINLTIGTAPLNPPFGDVADKQNNFYGFDIDIMMEICKRIEAQCTFQPVVYNQLFPMILSNQIDLAISAIISTEDKRAAFLFSLPYLESNARFLTLVDSPINGPIDIHGKKVGVRKGTPFGKLATSLYNDITIKEYDTIADLLLGLTDKEVDIIITNDAAAKYRVANNSDIYKLIGVNLPIGDGYAIMANKQQTDLISQINAALLQMEADGTYLSIYSRYFGN